LEVVPPSTSKVIPCSYQVIESEVSIFKVHVIEVTPPVIYPAELPVEKVLSAGPI